MTDREKARLEGWSAQMLVSEVAMTGQYVIECKHADGREAESTRNAKEELRWEIELLIKKINDLEREAEVGRKATELMTALVNFAKGGTANEEE